MGLFGKKKKVPAVQEHLSPQMATQADMASTTTGGGQPTVVEDAVQYRVPPGTTMAPGPGYQEQTSGHPRVSAYPETPVYPSRGGYERSAPPTPRGYRDSYYDEQPSTYRTESRRMKTRRAYDDCRSDDDSCYRSSSSACSGCRQPSYCDCRTDSKHHRGAMTTNGTTEVYHTTYACYDPNCKGGSSCRHWKTTEESTQQGQYGQYGEITTTTVKQVLPPPPPPRPVVTTTTYQTTTYPQQPIYGQMALTQGPMMVGQQQMMVGQQQMMGGQAFMGQPYIVNRRQVPMMVGGVPVVIPAADAGAHIVGAMRTQPQITTRPLQF